MIHKKLKTGQPESFTNGLALSIMSFLKMGLIFGFILAGYSIHKNYMGALYCYTIVFTPIGTAGSIILNSTVKKSENENTDENGKGIKYAIAEANGFYSNGYTTNDQVKQAADAQTEEPETSEDCDSSSPAI